MSSSTLYEVFKTTARPINKYRNGHGSAPPVWGYLGGEYLGWDGYMFSRDMGPLWKLFYDQSVPSYLQFALGFTFDGALLDPSKLKQCADWSEMTYEALLHSKHWGPDKVNHWHAIAEDLRNYKCDKRALGVGIGCTSVCDPWESWPNGEISKGEEFDMLKEMGSKQAA